MIEDSEHIFRVPTQDRGEFTHLCDAVYRDTGITPIEGETAMCHKIRSHQQNHSVSPTLATTFAEEINQVPEEFCWITRSRQSEDSEAPPEKSHGDNYEEVECGDR